MTKQRNGIKTKFNNEEFVRYANPSDKVPLRSIVNFFLGAAVIGMAFAYGSFFLIK